MARKKTTEACEKSSEEPEETDSSASAAYPSLRSPSNLPTTSIDGKFMAQAGKYARGVTLGVFEMIGGAQRMAEWANENPGEYYTKIFSKLVKPEPQIVAEDSDDVEDLLKRLDRKIIDVGDIAPEDADDD